MTQDGNLYEMLKKNIVASKDWTLGVKMSQEYPNFVCSKFTTHYTPGGCSIVMSFNEWFWGIWLKNDAAAGKSINERFEQMCLMVDN
jgi:hypothetical protein